MGDEKSEIVMATRDRERHHELLIPVADSPDLDIASKPSSSSSASSSHHSGHEIALSAKEIDVAEWKGDILAVGVTHKDMTKDDSKRFENSLLKNLDAKLGGHLSEASSEEDFTGKPCQSLVLRVLGHGAKRIDFIGLGKSATNTYAIAAAAKNAQASDVGIVLTSTGSTSNESKLNIASTIASEIVLGTYEDNRFKSDSNKPVLKSVDILGFGTGPQLDNKLKYAEDVSSAVIFGKELLNSPANVLTPVVLAEEATKIASTYSDVFSATILNAEQCKELKMGSYLGDAAASKNPPHFIHLCYKPPSGPIKAKLSAAFIEAQLKSLLFAAGILAAGGTVISFKKFDSFLYSNGLKDDKKTSDKLATNGKRIVQKKGGLKALQVLASFLLSHMGKTGAKDLLTMIVVAVSLAFMHTQIGLLNPSISISF
uniref:Cytosol aminopeptidase domain-containing protein n=1 Tax=Salix viminalis TaxID=40686 RepID=A0A6N2M2G9_SALVM